MTNTEQHQTLMAGVSRLQHEIQEVERRAEEGVVKHLAPVAKQFSRFSLEIEGRVSKLEGASGKPNGKARRSWMEDSDVGVK